MKFRFRKPKNEETKEQLLIQRLKDGWKPYKCNICGQRDMHPLVVSPLTVFSCKRCGETNGLEYVDIWKEMENEIRRKT
jgi:hypothetical protein